MRRLRARRRRFVAVGDVRKGVGVFVVISGLAINARYQPTYVLVEITK